MSLLLHRVGLTEVEAETLQKTLFLNVPPRFQAFNSVRPPWIFRA